MRGTRGAMALPDFAEIGKRKESLLENPELLVCSLSPKVTRMAWCVISGLTIIIKIVSYPTHPARLRVD